jgi:hypothetical protein
MVTMDAIQDALGPKIDPAESTESCCFTSMPADNDHSVERFSALQAAKESM